MMKRLVAPWGLAVLAGTVLCTLSLQAAPKNLRVVQTNSAGDNIQLIDPATNTVVGKIDGIEVPHGVSAAPDGSRLYVTCEADNTLDVVDMKTLNVTDRIPLSGNPNNVSITPDGRKVYVGIIQKPGAVDVIDTASLKVLKTIPTKGVIHNVYVTPDGKYLAAGSSLGKWLNVIDTATDEMTWQLDMGMEVRPMAFAKNPDGSTKWIFVQGTVNGFVVVDFATHQIIKHIMNPDLAPAYKEVPLGADPSHGIAVTEDGRTLVVNSRVNNFLYTYSLPDLKLSGSAYLGEQGSMGAAWVTLTPDSKRAYVAMAVTNDVVVVDLKSMKEIACIPVGYAPRRNITAMLQ
jgi:YVTN family beta-propeller protein